jgi:hypothetical protein
MESLAGSPGAARREFLPVADTADSGVPTQRRWTPGRLVAALRHDRTSGTSPDGGRTRAVAR